MKFLISAILLFLLPGASIAFWRYSVAQARSDIALPLALGIIGGVLVDRYLLRRWRRFHIFEHELTHALAALMFLHPISAFVVRHDGGYIRHRGGFGGVYGDDFIGLAPYVVPTFTLLSVLTRPFVPGAWFPWYDVWVGCTFGYHLHSTYWELRGSWTSREFHLPGTSEWTKSDVASRGRVYSGLFILTVTLMVHGLMFAILFGGYGAVRPWFHTLSTVSWRYLLVVAGRVAGFVPNGVS